MNIQNFLDNYKNKQFTTPNTKTWDVENEDLDYLFSNFGGLSVDLGAFRIHTYESSKKWSDIIVESFPNHKNNIIAYGFDWMGRQYTIDIHNDQIVRMFDGSTREEFEMEQTLEGFFKEELVDYGVDTLTSDDFEFWNKEKIALKHNEIVSFKIPLALGGKESPENQEIIDAEVDWEINRQLLQ
jgi:hypothetical protein